MKIKSLKFWQGKVKRIKPSNDNDNKDKLQTEVDKKGLVSSSTVLEDAKTGGEAVEVLEGVAGAEGVKGSTEILTVPEAEEPLTVSDYADYLSSGVFIFGKKIEGRFGKLFFGALTIGLLPPTFIFGVALLICIFLLLFPLIAMLLLVAFPTVIFSLLILFAALPVVFPFLIIFLLFTDKGKFAIFSEGKTLILKLFHWTFPTE